MPLLLRARHGSPPGRIVRPPPDRPACAVTRSWRPFRSASQSGSAGRTPQAASTASGNLAGCAVPSTIIGIAGSRTSFSATRDADRGVRIDERPVSRSVVRIAAAVSSSSARPAPNSARISDSASRRQREAPRLRQRGHQRADRGGVAAGRPRTAGARSSTRPGCPSTARRSPPPRARS